jgi:hypothetical protein
MNTESSWLSQRSPSCQHYCIWDQVSITWAFRRHSNHRTNHSPNATYVGDILSPQGDHSMFAPTPALASDSTRTFLLPGALGNVTMGEGMPPASLDILQCRRQSPQQIIILSQMLTMPRLRGPPWTQESFLLGSGDSSPRAWPPRVSSMKGKQDTIVLGDQPEWVTWYFSLKICPFYKDCFPSPIPELKIGFSMTQTDFSSPRFLHLFPAQLQWNFNKW